MNNTHNDIENTHQPPAWVAFFRHQATAIMATALDYCLLYFLYETSKIYYPISVGIGAFGGAIFAFLLGRYWAFQAKEQSSSKQLLKYAIVNMGSISLNVFGVMLFTEVILGEGSFELFTLSLSKVMISKVIVATCIGIPYNFLLQKNWVFN